MKPAGVLKPVRKNISGMSKHVLMDQKLRNDHHIDFDNSRVIDKGSFRIRKILEAWYTSATKHADNNSKAIPNSIAFFLNNSHLFHTFTLLLFFSLFFLAFFFLYIYFIILHSMFYPSKAVDRQPEAYVLFEIF